MIEALEGEEPAWRLLGSAWGSCWCLRRGGRVDGGAEGVGTVALWEVRGYIPIGGRGLGTLVMVH